VDLDETLFWPGGWIGSEDWLSVRKQETKNAFNELVAYEKRITQNGYMVATDPQAVAVIQNFQKAGIEVMAITARSAASKKRADAALHGLGLELEVIYVASHHRDAKAQRIKAENEKRGIVRSILVDNLDDNLYALEVLRVPETTGVLFEANRHERWKDPWFYVERARRELQQGNVIFAQEDLISALELSMREFPPSVIASDRRERPPRQARHAGRGSNLLNAEKIASSSLENAPPRNDTRINLCNEVASLIYRLRDGPIDLTPLYQVFLRAAADLLYDFSRGPPPVGESAQTLSHLLDKFFPLYFPAHGSSLTHYYAAGLIKLNQTRNATEPHQYELVVDETNLFVYLEPILCQIFQRSLDATRTLDKIIVIDSGARPILWAIEAFVQEYGLNVEVVLLPLSVKTNGDTLKSTRRWMNLGFAYREGRLTESLSDDEQKAVEAFAKLFPLADQSVLIIDDNMVSGDTLDIVQRVLVEYHVKEIQAAVLFSYRDSRFKKEEIFSSYQVPGEFFWRNPMPVILQTSWEEDLTLRGIKPRVVFSSNPIPQALKLEDQTAYARFLRFKNTLIDTFSIQCHQYEGHLVNDQFVNWPMIYPQTGTLEEEKKGIDLYARQRPVNQNFSDFTLEIGEQTLFFKMVQTVEEQEEYIARADSRPMDQYRDQFWYEDFEMYRVYASNGRPVGVLEIVTGRLTNLKESALILEYVDLDYDCKVNCQVFVAALRSQLVKMAQEQKIKWVLIPTQIQIISGRPEIMRAFQDTPMMRLYDQVTLNESLKINGRDETWPRSILERLRLLFAGRILSDAPLEAVGRYEDRKQEYEETNKMTLGLTSLLRYRFSSLTRWRLRVVWREGMDWDNDLPDAEEELKPYLFDRQEYETARMIKRFKDWDIRLNKTQRLLLERIYQRRQFFESDDVFPADWQKRFMDRRGELGRWGMTDKLQYQALECYAAKLSDRSFRYPDCFFDGDEGKIRAGAIARYVLVEQNNFLDLRKLTPGHFAEWNLLNLWDGPFARDMFAVAEAVFPGQYERDDDDRFIPRPLTNADIIRWMRGEIVLVPGRALEHSIIIGQSFISIYLSNYQWGDESLSVESKYREQLQQQNVKRVILVTFQDVNLGILLGIFIPKDYEQWLQDEYQNHPIAIHAFSQKHKKSRLADPFIMDLNLLKQGQKIEIRDNRSLWRYRRARVSVYSRKGVLGGYINFQLAAFIREEIRLQIPPEKVKEYAMKKGDEFIVIILMDHNHLRLGPIAMVFRAEDFNEQNPENSKPPVSSYVWIEGQWRFIDLALLDIFSFGEGRKDLKGFGRRFRKNVSANGNIDLSMAVEGKKFRQVVFYFTHQEMIDYNLKDPDVRVIIELKSDEQDYSPYVALYSQKDHQEQLIATNFWIETRKGNNNARVDFNCLALVDYTLDRENVYGNKVNPRVYEHPRKVPEKIIINLQFSKTQAIEIRDLDCLVDKRPIFLPERNLQFGWIIKVHDVEAWRADPLRSPDVILVRDIERKALVPIDVLENRIITEEERIRFQQILEGLNIERLLAIFDRDDPDFLEYLESKMPVGFLHALGGRSEVLLDDWFKRHRPALEPGATPAKKPSTPSTDKDEATPSLSSISPEVSPLSDSTEPQTVSALGRVFIKHFYPAMLINQQATMETLQRAMIDEEDPEWREAYRMVYEHYRWAMNLVLDKIHYRIETPQGAKQLALYQFEGIDFCLNHPQAILADEPGLGKTVEALSAAIHTKLPEASNRLDVVVIIVPGMARQVWVNEIRSWTKFNHDLMLVNQRDGSGMVRRVSLAHHWMEAANHPEQVSPQDERVEGFLTNLTELFSRYTRSPPKETAFVILTYDVFKGNFTKLASVICKMFPQVFPAVADFKKKYADYEWNPEGLLEQLKENFPDQMTQENERAIINEINRNLGGFWAIQQFQDRIKMIILDEAHRLRHRDTVQSRALAQLSNIPRKLLVTGTPLVGRDIAELWPLLNWLDPELFPSLKTFQENFPNTEEGRRNLSRTLRRLLLRRTIDKALPGVLPPRHFEEKEIPFSLKDRESYEWIEKRFDDWLKREFERTGRFPAKNHVFPWIMMMRKFTSGFRFVDSMTTPPENVSALEQAMRFDPENPKIKALDKIMDEAIDNDQKVVVFTRFVEVARALRERYAPYGVGYIDGSVPAGTRNQQVEEFQNNPQIRIFITTEISSESISLTAATISVHYDLYWRMEQASNRNYRQGQTQETRIIYLLMQESFDRYVLKVSQTKERISAESIEGQREENVAGDILQLWLEQKEEAVLEVNPKNFSLH